MKRTITLLTDFGLKDPFVGQMKGVIYNINEDSNIVDITHDISPHLIREAAVTLGLCYDYFPLKTIHVCVVDPGVGSGRRPIIVATDHYYFVGPDNGIFSAVYESSDSVEVIHITAEHYFLKKGSSTFHARDIFAPVAAWLSKDVPLNNFGERIEDFVRIDASSPQRPTPQSIEGEVVYIDRFGNAITNIRQSDIEEIVKSNSITDVKILCRGKEISLKRYYADAQDKELYAVINSNGILELFVYRDNASVKFDLKMGNSVGIYLN